MSGGAGSLPAWLRDAATASDDGDAERRRLRALRACHVLDTDPEDVFDDAVALAAQVCATPIALLTLVDEDRQWFKATVGTDLRQTPRELSFCNAAVEDRAPVVVNDIRLDGRFRDHPFVTGGPHLRAYAGVPLVLDDGAAVGTVCVLDVRPRRFHADQIRSLGRVASQVREILELRRQQGVRDDVSRWTDAVAPLTGPGPNGRRR